MTVYDKNGTPIERGDIVKVYHFTGSDRKRYYMYKQALGVRVWPSGYKAMAFDHLTFGVDEPYYEYGPILKHYEIVQSISCDHDLRPKMQTS